MMIDLKGRMRVSVGATKAPDGTISTKCTSGLPRSLEAATSGRAE
jgi:hypothetical protein